MDILGTFEGTLLNYYPIKASMILVDPTCGAEYGYTYHIFPAFITIVFDFLDFYDYSCK